MTDEYKEQFQLPVMLPHELAIEIDKWVGDVLKRGSCSSWDYGELWERIRSYLAAAPKPQAVAEDAVLEALKWIAQGRHTTVHSFAKEAVARARAALKSTAQG